MSRFLHVSIERVSLSEVKQALAAADIVAEVAAFDRPMLRGGIECTGEPVDIWVGAGPFGAAEDFGFVVDATGTVGLVCSDVDRMLLEQNLLPLLRRLIAETRVRSAVENVAETDVSIDANGTRRVVVRRPR